jgi:hypothetical protein
MVIPVSGFGEIELAIFRALTSAVQAFISEQAFH